MVRQTETDFRLVECFDVDQNACTLTSHCQLRQVFRTALQSYFVELDKVTLADITRATPPRRRPRNRSVSMVLVSEMKRAVSKTLPQPKTARSTSHNRA